MPEDPSNPSAEEFSVRLSWPKPGDPAPAAAPTTSKEPARPERAAAPAGPARPTSVPDLADADDDEPAERAEPTTGARFRREARSPEPLASMSVDGIPPGKVFVEAFDRLADRLLDRLRTLRQDVDADLSSVRTELASLRQVVEELGDRSQLRQLQGTVDELRTELGALRRAVLEWPELEQVSNDIAAVRGDLAFLFESGDGQSVAPPSDLLGELQGAIATLSDEITRMGAELPQISAMGAVLEEVASVRSELAQVRRRMTVRSGPLDEAQLEQIVSAVAARVVDELTNADPKRRRR